jgi:hypothetical protein
MLALSYVETHPDISEPSPLQMAWLEPRFRMATARAHQEITKTHLRLVSDKAAPRHNALAQVSAEPQTVVTGTDGDSIFGKIAPAHLMT